MLRCLVTKVLGCLVTKVVGWAEKGTTKAGRTRRLAQSGWDLEVGVVC